MHPTIVLLYWWFEPQWISKQVIIMVALPNVEPDRGCLEEEHDVPATPWQVP